jgi:lipoprotein signal peptidase
MSLTARRRVALGAGFAAVVLAADQASKHFVLHGLDLPARGDIPVLPPLLDLSMVWNTGVTFGLLKAGGGAGPFVLALIAIAVIAGLLWWLRRAESAVVAASVGAIAGGALGNVADRFRFGMVVDFIHVHWGGYDPFPFVFNLGDSAIVIGVGVLLLESMLPRRAAPQDGAKSAAPPGLQPPPPEA